MGGGLSKNLCWSSLVSLLFLLGSLLELVVLVLELTQTLCDIYGGDLSPTPGVYIDCGHPYPYGQMQNSGEG